MVSFFTMMGLPVAETEAASSTWVSCSILMVPRSVSCFTSKAFS